MHEKGNKQASVHWSAARDKECFSSRGETADEPLVNRWSTADFVPAFGLHRISLVRASGETFRQYVLDALEGAREACLLGGLFCRRPILTDPAPSPRRALHPDPPVVCPSFGIDKSFFHRLEKKKSGILLAEPSHGRPVLPVPAQPRRPAVRRPLSTRSWYVRVFDSTNGVPSVRASKE